MSEEENNNKPEQVFLRGAQPTPRHKLAAAVPFALTRAAIPSQVAYVPKKMSVWGNNQYGDCVTAEEAFNKAVSGEFISDSVVINWANKNGYLNGAMLDEVMDSMRKSGFQQDGHTYGDGGYKSVDYSNENTLKAALAIAPVKIGIDADALPSGAGSKQGWYAFGGREGQYRNEDHCTALCGYGSASYLFAQLGVALPAGVDPNKPCYLHFTWGTIGVVDHDWVMSTVAEAWLRDPTSTVDGQPQPNPGPQPVPAPSVVVSVVPSEVKYGEEVTITVAAQNAVSIMVDGQSVTPPGGSVKEVAALYGQQQVTANAVGADGTRVIATTSYNVVPQPTPVPPPPVPTPDENKGLPVWAWVGIALGAGVVGYLVGKLS